MTYYRNIYVGQSGKQYYGDDHSCRVDADWNADYAKKYGNRRVYVLRITLKEQPK